MTVIKPNQKVQSGLTQEGILKYRPQRGTLNVKEAIQYFQSTGGPLLVADDAQQ